MGSASRAVDRDQIGWQISNIATSFSNQKQFERAEQLYQQMLALVDSWSADHTQPLVTALQDYSRYLMLHPARWNDVPAVLKRYREVVIAGHGAATGIFRQNVTIGDLVFHADDLQRAHVRITAAWALAHQKQFDEAERLASEAIAIGQAMRPPQGGQFATQLDQIRKLRSPAGTSGTNPWFTASKPQD